MPTTRIRYQSSLDGPAPRALHPGFFDGWWNAPNADTHRRILAGSDVFVVAIAADAAGAEQVVGFVTGLTDGVLYGVITLLEVVPDYKGLGIGQELMRQVTALLAPLYRIDLVCGDDVVAFYAKTGYVVQPGAQTASRTDRRFQSGRGAEGGPAPPRPGTEHDLA